MKYFREYTAIRRCRSGGKPSSRGTKPGRSCVESRRKHRPSEGSGGMLSGMHAR